jgi:DnaJ-class molecular chaperone
MNYYSILGVDANADQTQIKRAYRDLVRKHHPDRGGNAEEFKRINEAYETLSDPVRRQQYDNPQPQYNFNSSNFEDVFGAFFRQQTQAQRKNKDVKLSLTITLEEVLHGKDVVATYTLTNGKSSSANIRIPPGVENGEAIRFRGLGDNLISNVPAGDLIVYVKVLAHREFERDSRHIRKQVDVGVFDLILGKKINVATLDGGEITVNVPAGTNPGTILSVAGYGLPDIRTGRVGNLYIIIKAVTPKIKDSMLIERIKKINDEISSST